MLAVGMRHASLRMLKIESWCEHPSVKSLIAFPSIFTLNPGCF
jgi:hypothetical protein